MQGLAAAQHISVLWRGVISTDTCNKTNRMNSDVPDLLIEIIHWVLLVVVL